MIEAQGLAFPAFGSMAFGTVVTQSVLVRVIFQVAGFAIIHGGGGRSQCADFCPIVAGVALCRQVLADQVFARNLDVENMSETRGFLGPAGEGMASRATRPVIWGMFYFVTRLAIGCQPFEICGGE